MLHLYFGSRDIEAAQHKSALALLAALGRNLAWGIIDAGLYLMARLGEFARKLLIVRRLHRAAAPGEGQRIVAGALPPLVVSVMTPPQLEDIRRDLAVLPPPPRHPWLGGQDRLGALGVLLLLFVSTFPVVMSFKAISDVILAVRISKAIGITMLFFVGYAFARHAGLNEFISGMAMVVIGVVLPALTRASLAASDLNSDSWTRRSAYWRMRLCR